MFKLPFESVRFVNKLCSTASPEERNNVMLVVKSLGAGLFAAVALTFVMATGKMLEWVNETFGPGVWLMTIFPSGAWLGWKFFYERGKTENSTLWLLLLATLPFGIVIVSQRFTSFTPLFCADLFLLAVTGSKEPKNRKRFDLYDLQSALLTGITSGTACVAFFVTENTFHYFLAVFTAAAIAAILCEVATTIAEKTKPANSNR